MSKSLFLLLVLVCAFSVFGQDGTQGSLLAHDKQGKDLGACPLKNTSVKTEISGFLARVRVRQEFENSFTEPIEAVYTFPLSQNGAVDDMTMTVGTRSIRGKIMKREEAREIYEAAKTDGKTASLLDQQRPNIFTQSVANIMPGDKVIIEISYVETLKYEDGAYEFVFPMTIGPRYIPGSVNDAAKISPPVVVDRPGHDISIEVNLNAGVPVEEIRSTSHDIQQTNFSPNKALITLKNEKTIPNKDFILRYDVTGGKIQDAILAHRDERGGFFTMILQPPDKIAEEDRTPKEIVFVLDTSGSMSGFPIERAKEAMKLSLGGLYPDDTFNFITFAGDTEILFERPVPATQANITQALAFLESRRGGGGTEMMKAIKASLDPSDATDHLRIVCFMTDGHVGNEDEIIAEVQRHPNARVFSFGIGSSVNRYLLDKIAEVGKGEAEYVSLSDDGSKAARKFYERVRSPLLTDLSIDWNGVPVADVSPEKLTDLFSAKPVIIHGRYTKAFSGKARLRGKVAGQEYVRDINVNLPEAEAANDSLASLWARRKIDELSDVKLRSENAGRVVEFDKQIASIGIEFRLMTNFTSFVAVEDRVVNQGGTTRTIEVPVALPEGMEAEVDVLKTENASVGTSIRRDPSGGGGGKTTTVARSAQLRKTKAPKSSGSGVGYGVGSGSANGSGSGMGPGVSGGIAPGAQAVMVTAESVNVSSGDSTETRLNSTVDVRAIQTLPVQSRNHGLQYGLSPGVLTSLNDGSENVFAIGGFEGHAGKSISGRATLIVTPTLPETAKSLIDEVRVGIEVDPEGRVVAAKSESGPDELRSVSETAAKLSTFAPAFDNGRLIRTKGVMVFKFDSTEKPPIFIREMRVIAPTEEDKRMMRLREIMHFWIYEALARSAAGVAEPSANESKFVRDGKAFVRIELSKRSAAISERLAAAGVEIKTTKGNGVRGWVPLQRLAALGGIDEVTHVAPIY